MTGIGTFTVVDIKKLLNEQSAQENVTTSREQSGEVGMRKSLACEDQAQLNLSQVTASVETTSMDNSMHFKNQRSENDTQPSTSNFTTNAPISYVNVKSNDFPRVKKIPKTAAQRAREHRMRKRLAKKDQAELNFSQVTDSIETTLMDNSMHSMDASQDLTNNFTINTQIPYINIESEDCRSVKKIPKTAAERAREHRMRKRLANEDKAQLKLAQVTGSIGTTSMDDSTPSMNKRSKIDCQPSTSDFTNKAPIPYINIKNKYRPKVKKIPKSAAQRAREWRMRKKVANTDQLQLNFSQVTTSTNEDCLTVKRAPKTAAERTRQWRMRKKLANKDQAQLNLSQVTGSIGTASMDDSMAFMDEYSENDSQSSTSNSPFFFIDIKNKGCGNKIPKTSTERTREWRARIKHEMLAKKKKLPKSAAERSREYRERQKLLSATGPSTILMDAEIAEQSHYSGYNRNNLAHAEFNKKFLKNPFGHTCTVCQRLWFKDELKRPEVSHQTLINIILPDVHINDIVLCHTCKQALSKGAIPTLAVYNGFNYPKVPTDLPPLDLSSERLISPRLPFMQIRRLRHVQGQYGFYGQVINIPVCINNMVNHLPREVDDDFCINVHIKRKKTHQSSYLIGLVNKQTVQAWVQYLANTPLYRRYNITVTENFFTKQEIIDQSSLDEVSEDIPVEESFTAQQHTLLWSEDKYLQLAPGEGQDPISILFDNHAEELSFPSIYLGQFRTFRDEVRVTPFMMATSELRRSDRRGVTPQHLLYMAIKILRLRVRDCLKHNGRDIPITKQQIESKEFVNNCLESNLAFLRTIPNSAWYWAERKRDLFAMIRQLGKPTMFLRLSSNEFGWNNLLRTLYRLRNNGADISEEDVALLSVMEKSTLINEDAVTCAIYFSKLVNILMAILKSKKNSPFGQYHVVEYFKRVEFQHGGSTHVHILLWLHNAPEDPLNTNLEEATKLIDQLVSVSASEASGNIELQTHKHTSKCYKKKQICRFEAPSMPCRVTTILKPMPKEHPEFEEYHKRYKDIRINLEANDYHDLDSFYEGNGITLDEEYLKILQAGIDRPRVFVKRQPDEKWHNPFNPFIFNVLKSNMDFQFITDEYSCAAYVVKYINKTDRGISDLQQQILKIMDEHPMFDIAEITRKMSLDLLNTIEMTSQEAAWFLLREPMSKSSIKVIYIPTMWPNERLKIRKAPKELNEIDDDEINIWKGNCGFETYEKRPADLGNVTLAQFFAKYIAKINGLYEERLQPRIIRYRNYDMAENLHEYKREMVTLHIPFRSEEHEVLAEMKFIKIYDYYEELILKRRKEFESNLDIDKIINICRKMCHENELDENEGQDSAEVDHEMVLYVHPHCIGNLDVFLASSNKLEPESTAPLLAANSLTIQKVEGGTFEEDVYRYNEEHSNKLLYMALSRVTNLPQNIERFYHGLIETPHRTTLQLERFRQNPYETIINEVADFISKRRGLSVSLFSCQRANIVILSGTWLENEQEQSIPNFNCIVKYKHPKVRGEGTVINHDTNDKSMVVTPHMQIDMRQVDFASVNISSVGELCAAECCLENGQAILIVTIYIHVNEDISDIIHFIHKCLLAYTPGGSAIIEENYDKTPMILSGDFNVNFASEDSKLLIDFFAEKFNLTMVNHLNEPTIRHGTTIETTFQRYLDKIESTTLFTYFSYHEGSSIFRNSPANAVTDN